MIENIYEYYVSLLYDRFERKMSWRINLAVLGMGIYFKITTENIIRILFKSILSQKLIFHLDGLKWLIVSIKTKFHESDNYILISYNCLHFSLSLLPFTAFQYCI